MEKFIEYLLEAWDGGTARRRVVVGLLIMLVVLSALPYVLFLSDGFKGLFDTEQKTEVLKGLLDLSKISAVSAFFLFLLVSLVRGKRIGKSLEDLEGYAKSVEEMLSGGEVARFNKLRNTTESDRKAEFLSGNSASYFMKARKTDEKDDEYKGVWIVGNGEITKTLFLSYNGKTNWIIDLGDDPKKLSENVKMVFSDASEKTTIKHSDGSTSKWKVVNNSADVFG